MGYFNTKYLKLYWIYKLQLYRLINFKKNYDPRFDTICKLYYLSTEECKQIKPDHLDYLHTDRRHRYSPKNLSAMLMLCFTLTMFIIVSKWLRISLIILNARVCSPADDAYSNSFKAWLKLASNKLKSGRW